jgi:hypothetical protein
VIVARRTKPWRGRPAGSETNGARGCPMQDGRGEIRIYTDVSAPSCVRVTGRQRVMIVNRTTAYRRSEGRRLLIRLGPYSARLRPQHAALFGPVGRFLGTRASLRDDQPHGAGRNYAGAEAVCDPETGGGATALLQERPAGLQRRRPCHLGEGSLRGRRGDGLFEPDDHQRLSPVPAQSRECHRWRPSTAKVGRWVPPKRFPCCGHYDGIGSGRCKPAVSYGLRVTVPGTGHTEVVRLPLSYCPSPHGGLRLRVGRIE